MKTLVLTRFCYAPNGTYGEITLEDGQTLYTVENPWRDNKPGVSCIPEGRYLCGPRKYNRGGYRAVEIKEVPNRKYILFHIANVPTDVRGCIGIGSFLGFYKDQWAVTSSRKAFKLFMEYYNTEFLLQVESYTYQAPVYAAKDKLSEI